MSDEQSKDAEVEGHRLRHPRANDEPGDEAGEVEGHRFRHPGANDEPSDEGENEVEAHRMRHNRYKKD